MDTARKSVADIYDDAYYERRLQGFRYAERRVIARELYRAFAPDTVLDVGCAVGVLLEYMAEQGASVHGVEAHPRALELALVDSVEQHDLRDPYHPPQPFDLVLCIEVAEHLDAQYADTLVDSLCRCGSTILFTAARPEQDGTHHVNCRPRSYWRDKFVARGYEYDDEAVTGLRRRLVPTRLDWIPRNLFVFRGGEDD